MASGEPFDPTLQTDPPGVSSDASQPSALRQMWDSWTSRPENNAAMINFGLQLMQPLAPGQTQLGHFAQAVGAGGEASSRNVAQEQERAKQESELDLKERAQTVREEEGSAYSQYMRNRNTTDKMGTQRLLRAQADWNKWRLGAQKPDDLVSGQQPDTTVTILRERTGNKTLTKAQILQDPALSRMAESIIKGEGTGQAPTAGSGTGAPAPTAEDIAYIKMHPELKDRFRAKFGIDPP